MTVKRYKTNSDTTITNAFKFNLSDRAEKANMGESDVMELFSIYAQASSSSLEKSRILAKFSIDDIKTDRDSGALPVSGSVNFYLKLFNTPHGQSIPEKYYISVLPMAQSWDEGYGLDMETYSDVGAASWLSASADKTAQIADVSFLSALKHKLSEKYVSVYNGLRKRHNFWFKISTSGSAPVLTGTEHEVDISSNSHSTAAHYATVFKEAVNNATSAGMTAALSGSSTTVVLVTNDVLGEAKPPSTSSGVSAYFTANIDTYGLSAVKWNNEGSDYYDDTNIKYTELPTYRKYIEAEEDVEINITSLVEEWIVSKTTSPMTFSNSWAQIEFTGLPADDSTITLISTTGRTRIYKFKDGETNGTYDDTYVYVDTSDTPTTMAQNLVAAVDAVDGHPTAFYASNTAGIVHLSQSVAGFGGNRKIDSSGTTNATITNSGYFTYGVGLTNNGIIVKLSGSYEDGTLEKTFYTKKFFARGSEFFFKRPIIEARWDSSTADDRGEFYISSSLVSTNDNKHTLYLYNYFRGSAQNIPDIGTGNIYVQLFNSSGVEVSSSTTPYPVTGGHYPDLTGIYTASFAINTTESVLRDVWVGKGDRAAATATLTVADGDLDTNGQFTEGEYIIITSTDGIKRVYVLVDSSEAGSPATGTVLAEGADMGAGALPSGTAALGPCVAVNNNLNTHNQATVLNEVRTAILHANGHNGKITCSDALTAADGAQTITLTQAINGTSGNTVTTTNISQITAADFTGGAAAGNASTVITFTGNPAGAETIIIISSDETSKTYTAIAGSATAADNEFTRQGTTAASIGSLQTAIDHANGHSGKINTSLSGLVLTLTQVIAGTEGNTTVTEGLTNVAVLGGDGATADQFTGGTAGQKRAVGTVQYHTGSFQIKTYKASSTAANYDSDYVSKITNIKSVYTPEEKPRFRIYTRKKNWQPNIYTVASSAAPISIVKNAYYKIDRESDGLNVISYGTGSIEYTKTSYDMSGSYFDFDMSLLEPGYSYEVSLVYKLDGVFKEQNEKFKFRVEK